jgi:flavin-dependent dehydrogenase
VSARTSRSSTDVVIIGGGLAGLTLALQLRQAMGDLDVTVLERRDGPAPPAAFKVGESVAEQGSHYLGEVLGLRDYLLKDQVRKMGLRFFFSDGANTDIRHRPEAGLSNFLSCTTYQVDRGRLENHLVDLVQDRGARFEQGAKVTDITLDSDDGHRVRVRSGAAEHEIKARWLVDASGRTGLLKRRLGLAAPVSHRINASWFRVDSRIDVKDWTSDQAWLARVPSGMRYISTCHLMGRGYWVWLIPLPEGHTSVGIVADPRYHPFEEFGDFKSALRWLEQHEPQCAEAVQARRQGLEDFKVMRDFAYRCQRVFSPDRWFLTGEAGVFADPLYSPGSDFIGSGNSFITEIIRSDRAREPRLEAKVEALNRLYFAEYDISLNLYSDKYRLMGNPQVWIAKSVWDFVRYWSTGALLFAQARSGDARMMSAVASDLYKLTLLDRRLQSFFLEWDDLDQSLWKNGFVDYLSVDFLRRLNAELAADSDEPLADRVERNVALSEQVAVGIMHKGYRVTGRSPAGGLIDPYESGLVHVEAGPLADPKLSPELADDLKRIWLDEGSAELAEPLLPTGPRGA